MCEAFDTGTNGLRQRAIFPLPHQRLLQPDGLRPGAQQLAEPEFPPVQLNTFNDDYTGALNLPIVDAMPVLARIEQQVRRNAPRSMSITPMDQVLVCLRKD